MHQSDANKVTCTSNIGKNNTKPEGEEPGFQLPLGTHQHPHHEVFGEPFQILFVVALLPDSCSTSYEKSQNNGLFHTTTFPYQPSWRFRNEEKTKCQNDTRDKCYKHLTKKVSCYFLLIFGS